MVMTVFSVFAVIYLAFRWRHLNGEWCSARPSTRHMIQGTFAIWLLGLLVAWYAPLDVLDISALARTYTNVIGFVFPIGYYSSKSGFSQVSILYNSIIWPSLPVLFILSWRYMATWKNGLLAKPSNKMTIADKVFLLFIGAPLFLVLGLFLLFFFHGGDTRNVAFGSSRIELGIWGLLIPTGVAGFIAMGLGALKKAISGKL